LFGTADGRKETTMTKDQARQMATADLLKAAAKLVKESGITDSELLALARQRARACGYKPPTAKLVTSAILACRR
jgi:hypothetical protein